MKTKPIMGWAGGKRRLAKYILPMIPPHRAYIEPFAGCFAIMLAKPERSRIEVINDTNEDLVRLFRCIKHHHDELIRELSMGIYSRAEFENYRIALQSRSLTEIQRSAIYLSSLLCSFGGNGARVGWGCHTLSDTPVPPKRTPGSPQLRDAIVALHERLVGVQIDCLPYGDCLRTYDKADAFFFCDPPYLGGAQGTYASWQPADIAGLRDRLMAIKGQWVVTLDGSPAARAPWEEAGCRITEVERANGIENRPGKGKAKRYREIIVQPPERGAR